ncbi:MAG: hypothetical protein Q9210_006161 [Variospora velana]
MRIPVKPTTTAGGLHSDGRSSSKSATAALAGHSYALDADICGPSNNVGGHYTKAGKPIQDTRVFSCASNDNSVRHVDSQMTVAHTLISQDSYNIQVGGDSVAVKAGHDFFAMYEHEGTPTWDHPLAISIFRSTGMADTRRTEDVTISQLVNQLPGTKWNIWFTPSLDCLKKKLFCAGVEIEVERCDPAVSDRGEPEGSLVITTI